MSLVGDPKQDGNVEPTPVDSDLINNEQHDSYPNVDRAEEEANERSGEGAERLLEVRLSVRAPVAARARSRPYSSSDVCIDEFDKMSRPGAAINGICSIDEFDKMPAGGVKVDLPERWFRFSIVGSSTTWGRRADGGVHHGGGRATQRNLLHRRVRPDGHEQPEAMMPQM